MLVDTFFVP